MADMLSQEEIDALLKGTTSDFEEDNDLTDDEKDALGEIGNISMGTSATTLFTLLGQKVTITTPKVSVTTLDEVSNDYDIPCVAVMIKYREGIEGFNLLILNEEDVKIITDLMMGGDGKNVSQDLTDIHLSAIGEAMNQMIGSSCTSLSEIFTKKIDILPPSAFSVDLPNKKYDNMGIESDHKIVKIAFRMTVGDLIDSEIMQIIPIEFAKKLVAPLLNVSSGSAKTKMVDNDIVRETDINDIPEQNTMKQPMNNNRREKAVNPRIERNSHNKPVNVQPLQFESFDDEGDGYNSYSDIELIKDVPLGITVELGRTTKQISEILDFGPGTVIELNRLVGEPLDIYVNGKQIAKGEVVVVDENYGIRITDIINPQKRVNNF
ncbi:flagellar motor switch phosphatase FliY [Paramaledivibacter caminithermalis]|jgi:flagellar motor switch protein FliN/FliY|uniref:Flagellar motor switch protein FliN/FliY n=1 Tax=Paramaledivibacter caminithermalis (strain DSM 15212 / CIP 107654 / DViRD3) TaxID=1121301 RepID=A0A1M6N726_PARC5|nr:flagellar motor switch phosphatase FliY [Paramaledivibacter caminithermalis]SHJ91518.1 flagellar motor switch protein FliN/FliY [Paramaledivibacter caminithermalis DSM 15212]